MTSIEDGSSHANHDIVKLNVHSVKQGEVAELRWNGASKMIQVENPEREQLAIESIINACI